jgi:hypothetical protein
MLKSPKIMIIALAPGSAVWRNALLTAGDDLVGLERELVVMLADAGVQRPDTPRLDGRTLRQVCNGASRNDRKMGLVQ